MHFSVANFSHYRLLVLGGGSAGLLASHKFAKLLPDKQVAVVEPCTHHYYQPGFTFVGGGMMSLSENTRLEKDLIHPNSVWYQKSVQTLKPSLNTVTLSDGEKLTYDYMIVACGMQVRLDLVKGLEEALDTPGVTTNYLPQYVEKTYKEIQNFKSGNMLFTFPSTPIKCPGAPQKICYIAEESLREQGVREKADIKYFTTIPRIFGIPKYAASLEKLIAERNIELHTRESLVEIDSARKVAVFEKLNEEGKPSGKRYEIEYSFLHVAPPYSPIAPLRECKELTDAAGWVDVDPNTLQSKHFPNVFAAGDCGNSPNPKTAAAIPCQMKVVEKNLQAVMKGQSPSMKYDGYTSCPLVCGKNKVILAEFNYKGPLETMPINQAKPSYLSFLMTKYFFPFLYWHGLIKGKWNGPEVIRKILHLGRNNQEYNSKP